MTETFTPKLVAPGAGKTVMLFGVRFSYKVVSADSGGSLAVLEVEIPPRTLVKPHNHSREDEFSLVLSGTVGVRVGDRVLEAGPGAYLVKPRGTPHAMWNTAGAAAKVAEILGPAGLEGYFEALAPILAEHGTPRSITSSRRTTASRSRTTGSKTWSAATASGSDPARLGPAAGLAERAAAGPGPGRIP